MASSGRGALGLRGRGVGLGFTLLELMLAVGLAAIVWSFLAYVTVSLSRSVRYAEQALARKKAVIEVAERLRWQLRCLYTITPEGAPATPPSSQVNLSTLNGSFIYSQNQGQVGRDALLFKTTYFPAHVQNTGTAEVGYTILQGSTATTQGVNAPNPQATATPSARLGLPNPQELLADQKLEDPYLAYRQYPWADPLGLHDVPADPLVPWQVLSREVIGLEVRFSQDLEIWQEDWTTPEIPTWIEVSLELKTGDPLIFTVGPAAVAPRW